MGKIPESEFPANRRQQLSGHKPTQKGGGTKGGDLQKKSMSEAQSKIQLFFTKVS